MLKNDPYFQHNAPTCHKHNYLVSEWDGDVARRLMCAYCLKIISYKDVKFANKKEVNVIYDIENDLEEQE